MSAGVIVVGAGGAGLRAAIAAREAGASVLLVTKGEAGRSGATALACSDRMAFHATLPHTEPGGPDAWRYHAEDIFRIGGFVSDGNLAAVLARESAAAFDYLDRLGVPFVRRDGLPDQFLTDGSQYARACYTGPYTANDIEAALLRRAKELDIEIRSHCQAVEVLLDGGAVRGLRVCDQRRGETADLPADAVILATGGAGEVYAVNVFPPGMTGDGYALAARAGAELVNLEFIQIGLCSVATKLACSGSLMRAAPRFVNERDEEFLRGVTGDLVFAKGSSWPVSAEHETKAIDLAVFRELAKGRRVFLDYGRNPEGFSFDDLAPEWQARYRGETKRDSGANRDNSPLARLEEINPESIEWLRARGVDLRAGDRVEIAPAVQHFQGGAKIGEWGETTAPGLFAAGECAGGQHGANRPGGNALLDTQVFGRRAGEKAGVGGQGSGIRDRGSGVGARQKAKGKKQKGESKGSGAAATEVRARVQRTMSRYASVIRTAAGLEEARGEIGELRQAGIRADEAGVAFACETDNLLLVAEMILRAAQARPESRGPHLWFENESDLEPRPRDEAWNRYLVVRLTDEGISVEARTPRSLPG